MKIFQITAPGAEPIVLEEVERIDLGEHGRGRKHVIVPVKGQGPSFAPGKTKDGRIVVVRGEFEEDCRCLAIINSVGSYDRYRDYDIHDAKGVNVIAKGYRAFGMAGRVNGGPEVLAIIEKDAEFRLNSKYDSYWYTWTGTTWLKETPEERQARLAQQVDEDDIELI